MKLDLSELTSITADFAWGIGKVLGLLAASLSSLTIAQALPSEEMVAKAASTLSGWTLAVMCIITLSKVVAKLNAKIEIRDKDILDLHKQIAANSEQMHRERIKELLDEIRELERSKQ
jgi:hypothetical protein